MTAVIIDSRRDLGLTILLHTRMVISRHFRNLADPTIEDLSRDARHIPSMDDTEGKPVDWVVVRDMFDPS